MRNQITEMFGIDVPIFAFSHCRDVVAAVTKAGGMGVLGAAGHSGGQLETDLRWIEEQVDGAPYGVDVIVPASYAGSDRGGYTVGEIQDLIPDGHRLFVADLLERYQVPELADDARGLFDLSPDAPAPLSAGQVGPQLDIALAHNPVLLVNALGPPPPLMIEKAGEAGRRVGALAGLPQHAERHRNAGVDVIIAQGAEAGGHTGEVGTMVLTPQVVEAVAPLPVLAAGGIGRGSQMAAAMALGAQGVWCGSVWLTTHEAETHPAVKKKFLEASSSDTVRSASRTGKPARQLRTDWTLEWERPDAPEPLGMPLQPVLVDEALLRIERAAHREGSGAERLVNYYVGQVVGSLNESKPAAQVVYEMVEEYIESARRMSSLLE